MMGFMSVSSMSSGLGSMMLFGPVFIHGYLTCGKILEQPELITGPWRVLLIRPIEALFDYGKVHRRELIILRADLEVYTGFYLIIGWFIGMSNLITILLYWQCIRVRSMLNTQTQLGFSRFDQMFYQNVMTRLPAVCHKPYNFIKSFMTSMGSPPKPASDGLGDTSLASMMAQSFRKCTIF